MSGASGPREGPIWTYSKMYQIIIIEYHFLYFHTYFRKTKCMILMSTKPPPKKKQQNKTEQKKTLLNVALEKGVFGSFIHLGHACNRDTVSA